MKLKSKWYYFYVKYDDKIKKPQNHIILGQMKGGREYECPKNPTVLKKFTFVLKFRICFEIFLILKFNKIKRWRGYLWKM